jgi:hypothetical protein
MNTTLAYLSTTLVKIKTSISNETSVPAFKTLQLIEQVVNGTNVLTLKSVRKYYFGA